MKRSCNIALAEEGDHRAGQGVHAFLPRSYELFDIQKKYLKHLREVLSVRWLPSGNIWCTKCSALGIFGTNV